MAKVNMNEAIENVRSLGRMFRSVTDLTEALGDINNLEQAANELNTRITTRQRELDETSIKLSTARGDVDTAKQQAETIRVGAVAAAEEMRDRAAAEAKLVTEKADQYKKAAEALAAGAANNSRAVLIALELEITAKRKELDELTTKLERTQAKIKELLGD